ncbi:acetate/propionate family kinase [Sphingomonas sp. HDW15A]|uniref:acetate/propionate family kinase n=1 Tax=Sphingomonas sp. HDW15A TaxID=2714942 RepID=UPI00140BCAC1|nr:acetate/propionate family kinase [Sphingomonas sp. HDW15A]QIK96754.1 acetate/propionate family kinase [Sphingomonas sp. HDW15A]
MAECIVVVNAGSSSVKFGIYDTAGDDSLLLRGQVEQIGVSPMLSASDGSGTELASQNFSPEGFGHAEAMEAIAALAREQLPGSTVKGIGHRVVHGGSEFAAPVVVTPEIFARLEKLSPLAPLHQPHNLAPIKAMAERAPELRQVACFDTAFHQTQKPLAYSYALPRDISDAGVRRYGFHGLSYEFVSGRLRVIAPEHADKKIVIAHLGNGASLCAIENGRSVVTTMGFTAVEGLMMGTRCGSIDPGVLLYLMDEKGLDVRDIENLIYKKSGLLGVSGITSDMRTLRASPEPHAREAIELFIYRIVREIGSLSAALGGLDGIVFTGGIGQRDSKTRSEVIAGCAWLGAVIDETANCAADSRVEANKSRIPIWVLPTDEERVIARSTAGLLDI